MTLDTQLLQEKTSVLTRYTQGGAGNELAMIIVQHSIHITMADILFDLKLYIQCNSPNCRSEVVLQVFENPANFVIGRIADDVVLPGKQVPFTFLNKTL